MRRSIVGGVGVFILSLAAGLPAQAVRFEDHFADRTMRIDYYHAGNAADETATLDRVYDQGIWAGSRTHLLDPSDVGRYRVTISDAASGLRLYSRGFDSYFGEYKASGPALEGVRRTYHESTLVPYPLKKVRFTLEAKDRQNATHTVFSCEIDPADPAIVRETPAPGVKVFELLKSGDPHAKVDVAFVAEGYTASEEAKVKADLDRFVRILFKTEPYASRRDAFNVAGVFKPSAESGTDEPSHGRYRATAVGTSFDSLGSERYLLTEDNRSLRDIAAAVPYDTLFIMVNEDRYGGGGIYNFFCTFTVDNQWHEYLFLHEFGHSFAGLADEYYTSDVAYNEFYPRGVEPAEANITALLDPANLKWKTLATPGTPIPTPWEKAAFDAMEEASQKIRREANAKVAKLKRERAPGTDIAAAEAEVERLSKEAARNADAFLSSSRFAGKVGAFEGAGYASEGLYRPEIDCLMFSKGDKPLCRVCKAAVIRVIDYYCE
jgi:hypothetical protein